MCDSWICRFTNNTNIDCLESYYTLLFIHRLLNTCLFCACDPLPLPVFLFDVFRHCTDQLQKAQCYLIYLDLAFKSNPFTLRNFPQSSNFLHNIKPFSDNRHWLTLWLLEWSSALLFFFLFILSSSSLLLGLLRLSLLSLVPLSFCSSSLLL